MIRSRNRRTTLLMSCLGILAMAATMLAAPSPVGAQTEDSTCPASVDTVDEGWICMLLVLNTPTSSPTVQQIELWGGILAASGRHAVTDGIVFSDASIEAKVTALYRSHLERNPDQSGLVHWRDRVQDARTEFAAEFGVFGSAEYQARFASTGAFVNDQYRYYLGREAGPAEQAHWTDLVTDGQLSTRGVTRRIAQSREAGNVRAGILYAAYTNRTPDAGGLQVWSRVAASTGLYATVVDFARYPEIVGNLGRIGTERAVTDAVEVFFSNTGLGDPCEDVFGVPRTVPRPALATAALQALLRGPTEAEQAEGYSSFFSQETAGYLDSVTITDGVAHADFRDFSAIIPNASTSCGSTALLAQLDTTLEQFPTVEDTRYSFDGDTEAFYSFLQRPVPM